ncbi:MAG: hypothetical protein NZ781_08990, partial [Armatimonadetes bacterium]|nr:hypothetical protein [Armatimonadota bacterium]
MSQRFQSVVRVVLIGCMVVLFAFVGRYLSNLYGDLIQKWVGDSGKLETGSRIGIIIVMALIGYLIGSPLSVRAAEVMA